MRKRYALLASIGMLAGGLGIAAAQNAGIQNTGTQNTGTYDPAQLPATQGKVAQYSLSPRGDVDGLILADGTEVHLPPHLGAQLAATVKPGDAVTVHGLRARSVAMVQAMSVSNDASGATVTDTGDGGPHGPHEGGQPLTAAGKVKEQLHGPRGDLNGALLEDGTIIRLPPPEAQRLAATLTPGAELAVQGEGYAGPLGRVIAARAIGGDAGHLLPVAAPPPHGEGHHPPHGPPHGPDAP